jgi:hypothetical protein
MWQAVPTPTRVEGCYSTAYQQIQTTVSCHVWWGPNGTTPDESISFPLNVETQPPTLTASPSRGFDFGSWYNHPVDVRFAAHGLSGDASCSIGGTPSATAAYAGEAVTATCTDPAGNSNTLSFSPDYDASPPIITGWTASRPPDSNGWYNHAVSFRFTGADPVSGIDSCSTITYSGPDSGDAIVVGSCRDNAGNVASLGVPFQYDATPPSLRAFATAGDQDVHVSWQTSSDTSSLTIARSPGVQGDAASVVDRGGDGIFNDTRVKNGVRYTYTITSRDQAGNVTVRTVHATPGPHLLSPVGGVQVTWPRLLLWTPVRHATYYNVQLYREGRKVLSIWPSQPELALSRSWTFARHRFALKPGRYRWYVWPGLGSRRAARYGSLIGAGTFVVARRS